VDNKANDPIQPIRQMLMQLFAEEETDPMEAMTAMLQLAAKISYDSGKQDKLAITTNSERWMGGCMLAFDAVAGEHILTRPPAKRHLSICPGVGTGAKNGMNYRRKLERERSRAANKVARASRKKLRK